jgi:hypothetical protein
MENAMDKQIWYGIKSDGDNQKVRLFSQDPSSNPDVSGVGQCTLTSENGNLDVIFDSGSSLFSDTTAHESQTQTAGSSSANAA